jgi:nucleoside-diphosphate-sugar epimerase
MALILVTGAAGFVGSHLCESPLRRRCRVLAVDELDELDELSKPWVKP